MKTQPVKKKKEKKNRLPMKKEEEEEKKKRTKQPTQEEEKKKSKVVKSCSWYCLRIPYMCLIIKMPLSYELWKLKTHLFSVFITHNSKIRELSDGNRVIVCQITFLLWIPLFLSYEL